MNISKLRNKRPYHVRLAEKQEKYKNPPDPLDWAFTCAIIDCVFCAGLTHADTARILNSDVEYIGLGVDQIKEHAK